MKKNYLLQLTALFLFTLIFQLSTVNAQSPDQFKYQAVLRDASGNIIATQQKEVVIDLLQGSENGQTVFSEIHNVVTSAQGIINLNIGSINSTGIGLVNWNNNTYFIRITVGGIVMGTSQLVSVPYALNAKTVSTFDYQNLTSKPFFFSGNYNDLINKPIGANTGDIQYWNGTDWINVAAGLAGQYLQLNSTKTPIWSGPTYPAISTTVISSVTTSTAAGGGNVTSDGGASVSARGVCWSTTTNPTIANPKTSDGAGVGSYTSNLTGLTPGTTYNFRSYATSSVGTAYGNEVSFTTSALNTVTDADGNVYNTVTIGTQVWMLENLKVTKYNDGTTIPNVTDGSAWSNLSTPGFCWYNNDISYKNPYGALYNWYTVNTGKLAPVGWHVPTDAEWTTLITFLGGESVAADKLKETGTTHWQITYAEVTNEVGFTALPGGARYIDARFVNIGSNGDWWSSTTDNTTNAWKRNIYTAHGKVSRDNFEKQWGFSVRCIKGVPIIAATTPTISTSAITNLTSTTATSGGNITSDGGASVTARGICWKLGQNPTINDSKTTDGTGAGSFTSNLTGLQPNADYWVRAYATNSQGTAYGNAVLCATLPSFTIGQSYQGGIIAYILQPGDLGYSETTTHGIIAAPSDQSKGVEWGCEGTLISGADGTIIGTGNQNTIDIMATCSTSEIPARLCGDLILGGYSDWYLPSFDELKILYQNRVVIGGFAYGMYWSSSETHHSYAAMVNFNGGYSAMLKHETYYVRAIRSF